ncbi:hypothetical protein BGX38DRAFT_1138700 [Terfezia claveryi]|nr:hypothetical protein BGX38DRAFT_1138700 [Terfezia claveryi]
MSKRRPRRQRASRAAKRDWDLTQVLDPGAPMEGRRDPVSQVVLRLPQAIHRSGLPYPLPIPTSSAYLRAALMRVAREAGATVIEEDEVFWSDEGFAQERDGRNLKYMGDAR